MDVTLERVLSLIPKTETGKYVHGEKKKFCESIGAPTNIISEWEKGKTKSYRNYLYVIADVYHVSVDWLQGNTDKKTPSTGHDLTEGERSLIELFRQIPEDKREFVLQMIRTAAEMK